MVTNASLTFFEWFYRFAVKAASALISNRWKQLISEIIDTNFIEKLGEIYDLILENLDYNSPAEFEEMNSEILNILIVSIEEIPQWAEIIVQSDLFYYALRDLRNSSSINILKGVSQLLKTAFKSLEDNSKTKLELIYK